MPFVIQWIENCTDVEDIFTIATPAGTLQLSLHGDVITQVDWQSAPISNNASQHPLARQLDGYWRNPHAAIAIKLLKQGSPYRHQVWSEMGNIPLGQTLSYAGLAQRINSAARAVGNACRDNPYPLFIPCHRVVSRSGLGGYCGQTQGEMLAIKTRLLAFETSHQQ